VPLNSTIYFYNNTNSYGVNNPTYQWDFGDGHHSTGYYPSNTYVNPGTYTVTLVATDPVSGCSSSYSQTIMVNNFNYAFQMSSSYISSNSCPPVLVRFTNTSYNYIRVSWDFGDGVTADNINYPTHIYDQPGKYIVVLSVFGPNGLTGQYFDSVFVRSPTASLLAKVPEICIGQSDELDAHSTAHTIFYTWDFGDGSVSGVHDSSITHAYLTAGTYLSKLIVTDTSGCAAAANTTASVKVRPLPVTGITPAQPFVCLNGSVNLVATGPGGSTFTWSPATGLSDPNSGSPIASPLTTTTYQLTITDDIGCTNTAGTTVMVVQPEKVTLTPDTSVCRGNSIKLQAAGASIYAWIDNLSGLSDPKSATTLVQPPVSATYTVTGSDVYSCFTDTATVNIQVLPVPSVNAGPDIEVMAGTQVQLSAAGSSDVIKWSWTPTTYLSCSDCAEPTCNAISQTQYAVKVRNGVGCDASDTILVKMECEESKVAIPNAFTPNGDGNNDVFIIKGISIVKHLVIFDRNGEKVFERNNFIAADRSSCWNGNFNGHAAPTGIYVYFVEMQCPLGGSFTRKGTVVLIR
jgi:gliding motility-associated-like protein